MPSVSRLPSSNKFTDTNSICVSVEEPVFLIRYHKCILLIFIDQVNQHFLEGQSLVTKLVIT